MKTITINLYKYEELSKEAKQKAIEDKREEMYKYGYYYRWVIDDCSLLEPPHKELEKLYKKHNLVYENLLIENTRKIYYSLDRDRHIDISEGMKIKNNFMFLYWLGLNKRIIDKIYFEISKDTIIIEEDIYKDVKLTKLESKKVDKAIEKFEGHCQEILNRIEEGIEYLYSDEFIIQELINLDDDFTENGEIY